MKFSSDAFHRAVSIDSARRRSVGASDPHVAAPYTRALVGDSAQRRSLWGPYPRLERLMRFAVVVSLTASCWLLAIEFVLVLVNVVRGIFW